ncbi:hypothetical protein BU16DRAFT_168609 [Lophium mytilinum]|uniref:Uncharacterized protein n=1 Tax=Lophium mytilinum TaxID=390894 RepID=A0A6A6QC42_9PEZI|nr:hypothetical protein BU16DRAFT_168609 [Lophium mytilinum]
MRYSTLEVSNAELALTLLYINYVCIPSYFLTESPLGGWLSGSLQCLLGGGDARFRVVGFLVDKIPRL